MKAPTVAQNALDRALSPARGVDCAMEVFFGRLLLVTRRSRGRNLLCAMRDRAFLVLMRQEVASGATVIFRSQWAGGWLCASPWIIGFILFTGGPILFAIVASFCDYDILNPARFVGLANYRWMFTRDPLFWKWLVIPSTWSSVFRSAWR